jgi:hypothetical protein
MGSILRISLTPRFSAVESAAEPQETVLTVFLVISAIGKPLKPGYCVGKKLPALSRATDCYSGAWTS